ncbi:MAG: PIN domain-containing protein [Terracidiphilus sp.]
MLVLLDSNILFSALLKADSLPARIVDLWLEGGFRLLTCGEHIEEIRAASRNLKFRRILHPYDVGILVNNLHRAEVWPGPLPRKHEAIDPADNYLLDLIEAAQPDYAVTGDKRSGLLQVGKLGRTRILKANVFCAKVLHL